MTKDEALKLALEALENINNADNDRDFLGPEECCDLDDAITAIKQALAAPVQGCDFCNHPLYAGTKCKNCGREPAPVQEPVAWIRGSGLEMLKLENGGVATVYASEAMSNHSSPLYTTPPAAPVHEQAKELAKLGWQSIVCPACGSEGARAFPKPAAPVQGCDFCNHPLYAGTKCKNCGREPAPVQEPVATVIGKYLDRRDVLYTCIDKDLPLLTPLYTTPLAAQRQWVEVEQIKWDGDKLIAKLKEKNT